MARSRQGVHRGWSVDRVVRELEKRIQDPWRDQQVHALQTFVTIRTPQPRDVAGALTNLDSLWLEMLRRAARDSLVSGVRADEDLAKATLHQIRAHDLRLFLLNLRYRKPEDARAGFDKVPLTIAQLLSFGWIEAAAHLADRLVAAVERRQLYDAFPPYRNPAAWFIAKLFADFRQKEVLAFPEQLNSAPVYAALLEHWREPENTLLTDLMLAACDRHTHECWKWSEDPARHGEFTTDPYFGWPIEIHSVLRLREKLGVINSQLDHPIMNTSLGEFRDTDRPGQDASLEAVMQKILAVYPEFSDWITPLDRRTA